MGKYKLKVKSVGDNKMDFELKGDLVGLVSDIVGLMQEHAEVKGIFLTIAETYQKLEE